jgi:arylsulfatase A-like enzyme
MNIANLESTLGGRPNIILILVDDMGFADLSIMGSEIRTPNIDRLARGGVLMSSMYNCARCCPTRASLLTGLYPHKAGIGHMTPNLGVPAYQGFLRNDTVTIAEVLRFSGYHTVMAGKWHVGGNFIAREADNWTIGDVEHPTPRQRGFDRFFGIVDGGSNYFSPHYLIENDSKIEITTNDFYFTDAITDKAIEMTAEAGSNKPFFLYLAHTAPHWPLQAPAEDIARYEGVYNKGWDQIRAHRHEEMQAMGVLRHQWDMSPRDAAAPAWDDIRETDWEAARMAVYAAQVDRMDQSIGRLIEALRTRRQLDNTLILFLSDNGGCAEFMAEDGVAQRYPEYTLDGRRITLGNIVGLRPGSDETFQSYELPWANVSNTPFRLFKHWVHEGGISTPLIAHWPDKITHPHINHEAAHVVDIMPTILDAAGAVYPSEYGGHEVQSMDGESLLGMFQNKQWVRATPIFWEHEGNSAIRWGNKKLVRQHGQPWELYDMDIDRTELNNLVGTDAPLEATLLRDYEHWAESIGVVDWNVLEPILLEAWNIKTVHG